MFKAVFKRFREDFFYGLFLILPVVATIWLVRFVIRLISGPLQSVVGHSVSIGVTFCLSVILISLIGLLTRNFIGKTLVGLMEAVVKRIPFVNSIYHSSKQIIGAFQFKDKKILSAVLVEYPKERMWALGFVTQDTVLGLKSESGIDLGADKMAVFVPTTPNPTSGYFVYVKKEDVIPLSLTVEDSIKLLMSAGVVNPKES